MPSQWRPILNTSLEDHRSAGQISDNLNVWPRTLEGAGSDGGVWARGSGEDDKEKMRRWTLVVPCVENLNSNGTDGPSWPEVSEIRV